MKIHVFRAFAVAFAIAATASGIHAAPSGPTLPTSENDPEVRVVNNHEYRILVVLVDKSGRHHPLGHIAPDRAASWDLDEFTEFGIPVQVKVVVDEPVWSPGATGKAIRSGSLYISDNTEVRVWVESDLTKSQVELHTWG